ncbi:MAG: hypothetical protein QG610_831 [Euryarchaeota archaeon]|nr:hypothetical protein [Euryarchaeota archaeon]
MSGVSGLLNIIDIKYNCAHKIRDEGFQNGEKRNLCSRNKTIKVKSKNNASFIPEESHLCFKQVLQ